MIRPAPIKLLRRDGAGTEGTNYFFADFLAVFAFFAGAFLAAFFVTLDLAAVLVAITSLLGVALGSQDACTNSSMATPRAVDNNS
jgi:hypothetical protein